MKKRRCIVCDGSGIIFTTEKPSNNWVICVYCDGDGFASKKHVWAVSNEVAKKNTDKKIRGVPGGMFVAAKGKRGEYETDKKIRGVPGGMFVAAKGKRGEYE